MIPRGRVAVEFREQEVEVDYEIDGEVIWHFVEPALNQKKLTLNEEERITDACWEDQWI